MRLPSLKVLAMAVFSVGLVGLVTDQVLASTPTVKGKGKVFQFVNYTDQLDANQFNSNIAIAPEGQNLVITDVMVTNQSGASGTFAIRCIDGGDNPLILAPMFVANDGTFSHSFGTGLQCPETTQAQLTISAATSDNWNVTVSGYFRKGAP